MDKSTSDSGGRGEVQLREARIKGHSVPEAMKRSSGSATKYFTPEGAIYSSHAERTKTLVAHCSTATLCTQHYKLDYPYGSTINYALTASGDPFTVLSKLAEHTTNLMDNSKCSILVTKVEGHADKLATARATLLGRMEPVPKTEELLNRFMETHPGAYYAQFDDFLVFRLRVEHVRYIGGFGSMSWVTGEDYANSLVDPVTYSDRAKRAVEHMNEDHANDVLSMVRAFAGLPMAESATLLSIDCYGMDVLCELPDGKRRSRITFKERLTAGEQIRPAVIALTKEARAALSGQAKV